MAFDGFRIRTISPNDPIAKSFSIPAKVGDIAGDPLPTNKTALAAWYTARTDKSGRGNTYFMGVPEGVVRQGNWIALFHANFVAFCDRFKAIFQDAGDSATFNHGVWSTKELEFNQTTEVAARTRLGQQRSRQAGTI